MESKPTSSAVLAISISSSIGIIATLQLYCIMVGSPPALWARGTPARKRSSAESRLISPDHPHRVVLCATAIGVAQRLTRPLDLVLATLAHDLDRRFREADHPR